MIATCSSRCPLPGDAGTQAETLAAAADASAVELEGMLRIVAHDLRSPLQTILLCCDALERRASAGTAEAAHSISVIRGMVDQVKALIDDVLNPEFTGAVGAGASATHVGLALNQAAARHRALASLHGVELHSSPGCCPEAGKVALEPPRLQRVLANLLTNAIRSTPAGGRVAMSCLCLDNAVAIFIADTGCGIADDRLPALFQPAAPGERPGREKGLQIVQRIVRRAGGHTSVSSRLHAGTTVTVILPRARTRAEPPVQGQMTP